MSVWQQYLALGDYLSLRYSYELNRSIDICTSIVNNELQDHRLYDLFRVKHNFFSLRHKKSRHVNETYWWIFKDTADTLVRSAPSIASFKTATNSIHLDQKSFRKATEKHRLPSLRSKKSYQSVLSHCEHLED
ncbi:hypothetical protein MRB53_042089 [Persea americana]|nr:hypothetical protein MRB53_042089 [Persea americana]